MASHVRGASKVFDIVPALASFATPYTAGDVMGIAIKLSNITLDSSGTFVIESIVGKDLDNVKGKIDLLFFDADPGVLAADNAAVALSSAQLAMLIGRLSILDTDWVTVGARAECCLGSRGILMQTKKLTDVTGVSSRDVWVVAVDRSGKTFTTATSIKLKLGVFQD